MDVEHHLRGRRPTWVEIELSGLDSNLQWLRSLLARDTRIMAVVKANAYGHGAVEVAERLEKLGVEHLAVAFLEEGLELRNHGIRCPILLLNGFWPGQEHDIILNDLTPAVFDCRMVQDLARVARRLGTTATYQIKIDTGLVRLGAEWQSAVELVEACLKEAAAKCEGIYTHLSSSEQIDSSSTNLQVGHFQNIVGTLKLSRLALNWHHAANSAAVLNFRCSWFDTVRPGLILYGINPCEEMVGTPPLKPLLTFKTRIMQLKRVVTGSPIGYGGAYTVVRPSVIATLPVGYADGLNRLLSNQGRALVRGHKVPIVGRISMDLSLIDVTTVPEASLGDEVVLIGKQGDFEISVTQLARLTGTIPYEVLCNISRRVPRVHIG
jgi:alanine racemase